MEELMQYLSVVGMVAFTMFLGICTMVSWIRGGVFEGQRKKTS